MVNEGELETQLEAHGWCIFVPEGQTIARQLEEISSAQIVSGIAGSAFHSVMLLRHVPAILMPVFTRIPKNENFETIRRRKGFEQIRVDVPRSALKVIEKGKWHGADTFRLLESIVGFRVTATSTRAFGMLECNSAAAFMIFTLSPWGGIIQKDRTQIYNRKSGG